MPEDKSSMLSSTCCRWMANVSKCPCVPNRRSKSSTTLGRRRRSCLFGWRIVSTSRMYRCSDDRRTRPSWSNLASRHLVPPIIHRVRIIRRNFATPNRSWFRKWETLFIAFASSNLCSIGTPHIWQTAAQTNWVKLTYECIGIQEDTFFELCQSPAVQFGECNA